LDARLREAPLRQANLAEQTGEPECVASWGCILKQAKVVLEESLFDEPLRQAKFDLQIGRGGKS
jgi:hypothetical protein